MAVRRLVSIDSVNSMSSFSGPHRTQTTHVAHPCCRRAGWPAARACVCAASCQLDLTIMSLLSSRAPTNHAGPLPAGSVAEHHGRFAPISVYTTFHCFFLYRARDIVNTISVCLSVCSSSAGFVYKQMDTSSHFFDGLLGASCHSRLF